MTRRKIFSLLTVVVVTGASCGGDGGGVSPEAYAADICDAVGEWAASIQERVGGLAQVLTPGTSPEDGKEALATLLDGAVDDTKTVITAVEDAGTPDVDNGEELAEGLRSALEEVQGILEDARADVDGLPSDPEEFQTAATEIQTKMNESFTTVGENLSDLESQELEEAFNEAEECTSISG